MFRANQSPWAKRAASGSIPPMTGKFLLLNRCCFLTKPHGFKCKLFFRRYLTPVLIPTCKVGCAGEKIAQQEVGAEKLIREQELAST